MVGKSFVSLLVAGALCSGSVVHALEVTAGSASVDGNMVGLSNKVDVMQAALTAAINLMLVCNKKGMAFVADESVPDRDADGCIATGGGGMGDLDELEVVEEDVTEAHPSVQCDGRNCSATLNMAPYQDKKNVFVQASCLLGYGWCQEGHETGSAAIPNMKNNWSQTIVNGTGSSKHVDIDASYDASTKIATFKVVYRGDSTNNKNGALRNVVIHYTKLKIQKVPTP